VRRHAERAAYDRETVNAILDAAVICHLGVLALGSPLVIPTSFVRIGNRIYLHGARANRSLALAGGSPVCVTVSILDGLVLARSAFGHSMNYRAVVVLGKATIVTDAAEKLAALVAFVDHVIPGRSAEVRPPSDSELASTTVLSVNLDEASAKIRTGPPIDTQADAGVSAWAGEVPMHTEFGEAVAAPFIVSDTSEPASIARLRRERA